MADLEQLLAEYDDLSERLKSKICLGSLLLVDLAGSTAFKTRHPEIDWVNRLHAFYRVVELALRPGKPTKYLGDGILAFFPYDDYEAEWVLNKARDILSDIEELNNSGKFPGDHAIIVRVILNSGPVYLFSGDDPQGTAVDKLFRMEKYVPDTRVGLTEEFVKGIGLTDPLLIGRFSLKGLSGPQRHALYLDGAANASTKKKIERISSRSEAANLWWLAHPTETPIYLVGGYIPPEEEPSELVQMGDKDAFVEALFNLGLAGDIEKVHPCSSANLPDEAITGNIVSIGGPCYNSVTRRLMEDAQLPVGFDGIDDGDDDETPLVIRESGERLLKSYDARDRLTRDWGLFARFPNPHNSEATVIIACGIESPASLGIVNVFSPAKNPSFRALYQYIRDANGRDSKQARLGPFCCIVPFKIETSKHTAIMPGIMEQTRRIIGL